MNPQDERRRDGRWTTGKLLKALRERRAVMVEGALFYDNEHKVRPDDRPGQSNQPRRFSLWEIHPVTNFYVCLRADAKCDPGRLRDWSKLEDLSGDRVRWQDR